MCYLLRTVHLIISFAPEIRKLIVPDLLSGLRRAAAQKHKMCHSVSALYPVCCVLPLTWDRPRSTMKGRFAYSLTVVHFRKVVLCQKAGSAGKVHPII